jgi:hypothetical protein
MRFCVNTFWPPSSRARGRRSLAIGNNAACFGCATARTVRCQGRDSRVGLIR